MKQELFSMFTKMEHWKDRGGLLTQAAPTPAGRQAVLRHVKELLTHYTSYLARQVVPGHRLGTWAFSSRHSKFREHSHEEIAFVDTTRSSPPCRFPTTRK